VYVPASRVKRFGLRVYGSWFGVYVMSLGFGS